MCQSDVGQKLLQNDKAVASKMDIVPASKTQVFLNVYDLNPGNEFMCPLGVGMHHSGIEVYGQEFSFASRAGVFSIGPRQAKRVRFRQQVEMGICEQDKEKVLKIIEDLKNDFRSGEYHLINNNCNHFCDALARRLVHIPIPAHVNRLANIFFWASPFLPRQLLTSAPTGDEHHESNKGFMNFLKAFYKVSMYVIRDGIFPFFLSILCLPHVLLANAKVLQLEEPIGEQQ